MWLFTCQAELAIALDLLRLLGSLQLSKQFTTHHISKACDVLFVLQAIWAICSKHHTMLPATLSSMVALAYLVLVR